MSRSSRFQALHNLSSGSAVGGRVARPPWELGQLGLSRDIIRSSAAAFAHSNLNTQIHGSKEAGKVPSSL